MELLKYPPAATSTMDKLEFCYIAQEKLRLEHNVKGKDYRDGKITKQEWEDYLQNIFLPTEDIISHDLVQHKQAMKTSIRFDVDLTDIKK